MKLLNLHSEPYGVTGNIGENFLRLLGMPALSQLQTVIREAVQNIADAAKLNTGPEILIRVRRLTPGEMKCFRSCLLAELPEEPGSRESLSAFLAAEAPVVLEICDFGTTGLGGPTRADRIPIGTERTDFINFLRNIGTPRDTEHGGGTYGFGKAALYGVSRCRTIFVDTLTHAGDGSERRLIGCHIGSRFETEEDGMLRQFTGRHWWGVADRTGHVADPVLGDNASAVAAEIGLPERHEGQSGTSIMIIDFETGEEELETIGRRIVEGLLWSFWPRMMRGAAKKRRFTCRVMVGDDELEVPAPENFPPLDLYCKAMRAARSGEGNDVRTIVSQRPARTLGRLALEKGMRGRRKTIVPDDSLFPGTAHHVALMRPVELVVRYLEGNPLPDERFEWAGVFLADSADEIERAFALSEPPAHDDWVPANMEKGYAKTYVSVALRSLDAAAREMGEVGAARLPGSSDTPPLARVAGRLGAALAGVGGDGAGGTRGGGGGGSAGGGTRGARASRPAFERLVREDGVTLALFSIEVQQDADGSGHTLVAQPSIAMDGRAARLDAALDLPEVARITAADGSLDGEDSTLVIEGVGGRFEILVRVPGDCAVTLEVRILEEEPA